jgi:hypothetical protein
MGTNRQVQSIRPSHAYSVEGPVRPYACQASPTLSLSKPGDHSNSTSRYVYRSLYPAFSPFHSRSLTSKPFAQPSSVHTIQDALTHVSWPQQVNVGQSNSNEATRQVLLEALPQILVLHLERFPYDAATDGINKINKPVQFEPELEIPLGTIFSFVSRVSEGYEALMSQSIQKIWHAWPENLRSLCTTSFMGCSITTASPQKMGTIRSTCCTRAETAVVGKLGCTLAMKVWAQCGARTCLGVMRMGGRTTSVFICFFILAPLLQALL